MSGLTKEYFDQQLKKLATKEDIRSGVDELAVMVKHGFDGVDRQLAEIVKILDVRRVVEEHERKIAKLEATLNVKL